MGQRQIRSYSRYSLQIEVPGAESLFTRATLNCSVVHSNSAHSTPCRLELRCRAQHLGTRPAAAILNCSVVHSASAHGTCCRVELRCRAQHLCARPAAAILNCRVACGTSPSLPDAALAPPFRARNSGLRCQSRPAVSQ